IGLRAYGQRDPLIEYKREAFALFESLLDEVRETFVQRLFRVQLSPDAVRQAEPRPAPRRMVAQHAEAQSFGGSAGPDEVSRPATPAPAAPQRHEGPRVGRNDPCPCGSGKKYKKCHMLIDQGVESGT
ncbi:MAG: SEC-C metal-binding domain-containing protein, partial [Candidatus Eiseniibacteriota bacterium]